MMISWQNILLKYNDISNKCSKKITSIVVLHCIVYLNKKKITEEGALMQFGGSMGLYISGIQINVRCMGLRE